MSSSRRTFLIGAECGIARAAIGAGFGSDRRYRVESAVPRTMPVQTLGEPPAEADVVVIGAGIAGISTVLRLTGEGFDTVVLEKGASLPAIGPAAPSRQIYSNAWDHGKRELTNHSKRIWPGFSGRFGKDIAYRRSGNLSIAASDDEVEG